MLNDNLLIGIFLLYTLEYFGVYSDLAAESFIEFFKLLRFIEHLFVFAGVFESADVFLATTDYFVQDLP